MRPVRWNIVLIMTLSWHNVVVNGRSISYYTRRRWIKYLLIRHMITFILIHNWILAVGSDRRNLTTLCLMLIARTTTIATAGFPSAIWSLSFRGRSFYLTSFPP